MAIVVPDGLLQNSSVGYVRAWLASCAEPLAVVSLPQETFIPFGTGIKTSVLFLRKKPGRGRARVFMARMNKVGYDVKGQPTHKRSDEGNVLLMKGLPILDDDVQLVTESYQSFSARRQLEETESVFTVPRKVLNSRLDVEHYLPSDLDLVERLGNRDSKALGELVDIVGEMDRFRIQGEQEIRYIAISDIDARTMQVVAQQTMKAHEAPSRASYRLREGDIITAVSGASTGTRKHVSAVITQDEDGAICSNGLAVLRNIRGIHPYYLLAFMGTEQFLRQVRRMRTGHAIPSITTQDLGRVLVPIVSEKEQERIATEVARLLNLRREALILRRQLVEATEGLFTKSTQPKQGP